MEALYLAAAAQNVLFNPSLVNAATLRVYLCGLTWAMVGAASLVSWTFSEDRVLLEANRRLATACWVSLTAVGVQLVVVGPQLYTFGSLIRLLYAPIGVFAAFAVYRRVDRLLDIVVGLVGLKCALLVIPRLQQPVELANRLNPAALGGRNVFGTFLMIVVVLRISLWAYTRERPPVYVLVGLGTAMVALVLTLARSPALGLVAGLLTVSLSSMRRRGITGRSIRSGLVMATALGPLISQKTVRSRLTALSFSNSSGRGDIWSAAWRFFIERPVFGHGFGSFTTTSPNIVEDFVTSAKYGPTQPGVPLPTSSAHNVTLQILAEGGIVGFAVVAWSIYFVLRASWHAVILPVLVAIFVDSLFDTFAYVVQVSWVIGLVFAVGLQFRSSAPVVA